MFYMRRLMHGVPFRRQFGSLVRRREIDVDRFDNFAFERLQTDDADLRHLGAHFAADVKPLARPARDVKFSIEAGDIRQIVDAGERPQRLGIGSDVDVRFGFRHFGHKDRMRKNFRRMCGARVMLSHGFASLVCRRGLRKGNWRGKEFR